MLGAMVISLVIAVFSVALLLLRRAGNAEKRTWTWMMGIGGLSFCVLALGSTASGEVEQEALHGLLLLLGSGIAGAAVLLFLVPGALSTAESTSSDASLELPR